MNRSFTLRPAFTPLNVGLMVLGFIVFWPLGLAMLAYMIWGDRLDMDRLKSKFDTVKRDCSRAGTRMHATGNVAFDEYRTRELERLEEERRRIDAMRAEFDEFMQNLRRARDQEEFDRFMANRNRPAPPEANA